MSHYQERLENDLAQIRSEIDDVGRKVGKAVHDAVDALLHRNRPLAYATVLGDHPINRQVRRLDQTCHAFVARHLPSAGHLRFISSVLRLNVELERIGDYAANIALQAAHLRQDAPEKVARDVELLSSQAERALQHALKAFLDGDDSLARETKAMAVQVGETFNKVWDDLIAVGQNGSPPLADLFALLSVFERLKRVSDQAKNICEETAFAVSGETKPPKVYRVLFIDEKDAGPTHLAVAFAAKAFPNSGRYSSAGRDPAAEIDAGVAAFLDEKGYDATGLAPSRVDAEDLSDYYVIVSLSPGAADGLDIPFHTLLLEWDLGGGLDEAHQAIRHGVRELMETLRGKGAD